MATVHDCERYTIYYRNLEKYSNVGLQLRRSPTRVHGIILDVDCNTTKRAIADTEFEKEFYKLLNNSEFGKTMENGHK